MNISKSLDNVMVDITVRSMLNPENPDFYIGNLTLDKLKGLFVEMNDVSVSAIDIFWKAFHIAYAKFNEQNNSVILKEILEFKGISCPECGCPELLGYKPGVRCPNCDYIEE